MARNDSYHVPIRVDPLSTMRFNFTRKLPEEFLDWPMSDLDDIETEYLVVMASAREAGDQSSLDYITLQLSKLDKERERQQSIVRAEAKRHDRRAPLIRHDAPKLSQLAIELKSRVSLVDFVEATGAPKIAYRSENRAKAHCPHPLHPDQHPSCVIDEQRFRCFSCGAHGDIFDLINFVWGEESFRERVRVASGYLHQVVRS